MALTLNDESVKDGALTDAEKNAKARVLRNGLAVVLFSILEDFIRKRTSEILKAIGTYGIPFAQLPERLRKASTLGLLPTISFRLKLLDESERLSFLQDSSEKIASTRRSPYELSEFALGYGKSNLSCDDIKDILASFMIDEPWNSIEQLASRLCFGALPLRDAFKQASERRHSAAHDASAVTLLPDLVGFVSQATAIAITYDCLISRAAHLIKVRDSGYLSGVRIQAGSCVIRHIELRANRWREFVEGRRTAVQADADKARVLAGATSRALARGELLVVRNSDARPEEWHFPSI